MKISSITISAILLLLPIQANATDVFEVRASATDATFYRQGKVEKDKKGDEVVYLVDIPKGIVTRTAVYVKNLDKSAGGGVQSDNSVYTIVHDDPKDMLVNGQRIIKAVGKVAALDGYETIVIGEDFVTTSKSVADYFVLYYYKRIQ